MFDSTVSNRFNYSINAVSGTVRKSHPKSKFIIRDLHENKCVFNDEKPRLLNGDKDEIVILQIMLIGDFRGLIEYVKKADFEEKINEK